MALDKTPNFGFNLYNDGDNPGMGDKNIPSTGLNNNAITADALLALLLNTDNTLKQNIIDKGQLKSTVADGATIEKDATVGLKVKDGVFDTAGAADAVQTALNTHQSSSDHDGRYYTETEVDALIATLVNLSTAQNVDGIKTFLQSIFVKNANPSYELLDADGNEIGRISGEVDGENILRVELWQSGAYKTVFEVSKSGGINFPHHTAYMFGKKLATEEYVQARVKSGTTYSETIKIATVADGIVESEQRIVPQGSKLVGVEVVGFLPGGDIHPYGKLNCDVVNVVYNLWLQNTSGGCVLMLVRPELFAGEPFASRMLATWELTDIQLPDATNFYVMPILSI